MIQSICLLGSFRVCADPFVKIPKKGRALLALLAIAALDGGGISRERLATMLWPYQGSEQARHSLRNCLLELRKATRADTIKNLITDYVNCRADMPTDIADFARLETSSNQRDLELAAELYRGELLDDFSITSEPFEEWLRAERDLWRARAMMVLARLSGIAHDNADHPVAITAARRLVQIDTLNEESQRLLIVTLDTAGQRSEAMRQYRRCRDTLKQELGIDPAPETTELAARLFANTRPLPAEAVNIIMPPDPKDEVLLRRAMKMIDEAREEIRDNLDHSASLVEALRRDREVLAKLLLRLEDIIATRQVGMKSLERMRDAIKTRLGDEYLAPAPRPRPQSNGEVGVELRA